MGKKEEMIDAVVECVQEIDGKKILTCAEAFELAEKVGAEPAEIGRICNQQKIRIRKCQLGCFK